MPPPSRHHRRPNPVPAPVEPLSAIVREYEKWRVSQGGKPARNAERDYWRPRDQKQGQRPDFLLWRWTQTLEPPAGKKPDLVALAVQALRAQDPSVQWAAMALVPASWQAEPSMNPARREELVKAVRGRLGSPAPAQAPLSAELIRWICRAEVEPAASLNDLRDLLVKVRPDWKPGRAPDLGFLKSEGWLPVTPLHAIRWLVPAIRKLARPDEPREAAPWLLTAWMMLRDARPAQTLPRAPELEVLLDAACMARLAGDPHEAGRHTALMMHLLPPQVPEPLQQRCRVAAWTLAEASLAAPEGWRVTLDDLPFPGEPPASEKGQEAARMFDDGKDPSRRKLMAEVLEDPEWLALRAAGVVLHHPLAALAWIGRKAQSYVVKKQHLLLQSAEDLASRHHCLVTTGKILAQWPVDAEAVVDYARVLRQSLRRMPFLRDAGAWRDCTANLRTSWGRLEADAITDPETVFMLHETVLDREVTTLRCLPADLRLLALRHLHSRKHPSPLVLELEADPRQMQQLEHQRAVELWSVASAMRERAELGRTVWVSLVLKGDLAGGRYSLLVQGTKDRVQTQGRLRTPGDLAPLVREIADAVAKAGETPDWLFLAVDAGLAGVPWSTLLAEAGVTAAVSFIPTWEWAFRVLRESESYEDVPFEVLSSEAAPPVEGSLAHACVLMGGPDMKDADTRWSVVNVPAGPDGRPPSRRSLSIGAHPVILSHAVLKTGALQTDLTRLSLGQAARCLVSAAGPAVEPGPMKALVFEADPKLPLAGRLLALHRAQPGMWVFHGVPF